MFGEKKREREKKKRRRKRKKEEEKRRKVKVWNFVWNLFCMEICLGLEVWNCLETLIFQVLV